MPPKAGRSPMEAKIEPLADGLPSIAWRWDPETDILSGSFKGNRKSGGLTGSIELTDAEGSVAVLLDRHWAVGIEYREKPDNLSFAGESDWADLFVGYFPNKHLALVLAYARLGEIATLDHQDGVYLSVQGSF